MRQWLVTALVGLVSLPLIAQAQEFKPPSNLKSSAMIAEGRAFFNQRCAGRCHGVDGQDGEFDSSSLSGKTYLDPPYVFAILISGRRGSAMPSWQGRLSDDELWKLIAFLSSLGDQARVAKGK